MSKTLDDFVKDGVVNKYDNACSMLVKTSEFRLQNEGRTEIIEGVSWLGEKLTTTQLRALSAMCLWAAEQVELQRNKAALKERMAETVAKATGRSIEEARKNVAELPAWGTLAEQVEKKGGGN